VGVESRDYMRDDGRRRSLLGAHRVTWWIIGINALLWFVYASAANAGRPAFPAAEASGGLAGFIFDKLLLHPADVVGSFRVWQLFTAIWFHEPGSVQHVFWNMLLLFFFGRSVESRLGPRRYLWLYLGGGLACTLAVVGFAYVTRSFIPALGASGAVFAVLVWAAFREPMRTVYLMFVLPIPLWLLVGGLMVGSELLTATVFGRATGSTVGHLAGAAFGWFFWSRYRAYGGELKGPGAWMVALRRRRAAQAVEQDAKTSATQRKRVDALLAKIHADGIGSLSEDEKAFLQEASKRYK
jgi:membrane associated rhomboid family serine protease